MKYPILMYHAVDPQRSVISIQPEVFAGQMRWLYENHISVLPLRVLIEHLQEGKTLPDRCAVLTFDDGFAGVYEHAFPVLKAYRFPATVFLVAEAVGRDNRWSGQPNGIPVLKLLDVNQIQEMSAAGLEFGSHTLTHPHLSELSNEEINKEVLESKAVLEARLEIPIQTFAYPYGQYNDAVVEIVKRAYLGACTTRLAFVQAGTNPFKLDRVDAYYLQSQAKFEKLFSKGLDTYLTFRRFAREVRQGFND
jgi:peptidoglycan/xylan/chitin deacetylase (PgdA/CDA1 family)